MKLTPGQFEDLLSRLNEAHLASHMFIASDGYPSTKIHSNETAAAAAVNVVIEFLAGIDSMWQATGDTVYEEEDYSDDYTFID